MEECNADYIYISVYIYMYEGLCAYVHVRMLMFTCMYVCMNDIACMHVLLYYACMQMIAYIYVYNVCRENV